MLTSEEMRRREWAWPGRDEAMCSRISRMSSSGRLAQISGESGGCVIFGIWLGGFGLTFG